MSIAVERIIAGDVRTVARTIRDIDDGIPEVRETLKKLYPYTGKAYVIGITGAPGVGKSTMVDQMVFHLRKQDKTVGVLAVDPTSPFNGGAILGDRVRMQQHSLDDGVFIRSMATRGNFGGLTLSTRSAIDVLDAMGKDYIIVETVGVGQDEVDIAKNAHTTIIVIIPGMGDDIQSLKAGILEVGDIFVINKAGRDGAGETFDDVKSMLEMNQKKYGEGKWMPPVLKAEAVLNKGIPEILEEIENHAKYMMASIGGLQLRRIKEKVKEELMEMVKNLLFREVIEQLTRSGEFDRAVESIVEGEMDPYTAADTLIFPKISGIR